MGAELNTSTHVCKAHNILTKSLPIVNVTVGSTIVHPILRGTVTAHPVHIQKTPPSFKVRTEKNVICSNQKNASIKKTIYINGSSKTTLSSDVVLTSTKYLSAQKNLISIVDTNSAHTFRSADFGSDTNTFTFYCTGVNATRLRPRLISDFDDNTIINVSEQKLSELKYIEY